MLTPLLSVHLSWLQIFLWSLKDNDLTGMAFIDTQLYIHQMISVKNFILAADVMKSISLLRYQEESKTLSLVSRVYGACRAGRVGAWAGLGREAPWGSCTPEH